MEKAPSRIVRGRRLEQQTEESKRRFHIDTTDLFYDPPSFEFAEDGASRNSSTPVIGGSFGEKLPFW